MKREVILKPVEDGKVMICDRRDPDLKLLSNGDWYRGNPLEEGCPDGMLYMEEWFAREFAEVEDCVIVEPPEPHNPFTCPHCRPALSVAFLLLVLLLLEFWALFKLYTSLNHG